jgi:hypothetical protein
MELINKKMQLNLSKIKLHLKYYILFVLPFLFFLRAAIVFFIFLLIFIICQCIRYFIRIFETIKLKLSILKPGAN